MNLLLNLRTLLGDPAWAGIGVIFSILVAIIGVVVALIKSLRFRAWAKKHKTNILTILITVMASVLVFMVWEILIEKNPEAVSKATVNFDALLSENNVVQHFDCEAADGLTRVEAFDEGWIYTGSLQDSLELVKSQSAAGHHCEYRLPVSDEKWKDYTITLPQPVSAAMVMARFMLIDPKDEIDDSIVGLAAMDLHDSEKFGPYARPRIAESVTQLVDGKWTLVVLDLRERRNAEGELLISGNPFQVQITISLKGKQSIKEGKLVAVAFDDVVLLTNTGAAGIPVAHVYSNDGLSSFVPHRSLSEDVEGFAWKAGSDVVFEQESTPELVRDIVGTVSGPLYRYPVQLVSERPEESSSWSNGLKLAAMQRPLSDDERQEFRGVIASIYIMSEEDATIWVNPYIVPQSGAGAMYGFEQRVMTNRWTTLVWQPIVDSTDYGEEFIALLLELFKRSGSPSVGFPRLVQEVSTDIADFGFRFKLQSRLDASVEDQFDGTIYLGNVTFLP